MTITNKKHYVNEKNQSKRFLLSRVWCCKLMGSNVEIAGKRFLAVYLDYENHHNSASDIQKFRNDTNKKKAKGFVIESRRAGKAALKPNYFHIIDFA